MQILIYGTFQVIQLLVLGLFRSYCSIILCGELSDAVFL